MTTAQLLVECEAIHGTFRQWQAEQEPLTAELSESLAALAAYQSHLDAWQQQLVCERDELRTLDSCRAELAAELDLTRAREKELKAALDEQTQSREQERAQWAEELRHTREQLQRHIDEAALKQNASAPDRTPAIPGAQPFDEPNSVQRASGAPDLNDTPVLGSILQQFGKLRQQRALGRPTLKKAR